jgi:RNA-directed DNA polymerase
VSNIQEKIVVAYRKGDFDKVHNLQYKLLMSFSARALAVRKVTTNKDYKTPGVDNII